jgi:DNA-binding beta-propeller fold protein YncE
MLTTPRLATILGALALTACSDPAPLTRVSGKDMGGADMLQTADMGADSGSMMGACAAPCACDDNCQTSGMGSGQGDPFSLGDGDTTESQGVALGPDGAITIEVDQIAPGGKYIWIANTGEGTLSKVDTTTTTEVARYYTGPAGQGNDPSRTSVNSYGDIYVGNRGQGSLTKILTAGADCADTNGDGQRTTSGAAGDLKEWGSDDCVKWNTPLCQGCLIRAVAAQEAPGATGRTTSVVWVGGFNNQTVWKLDGETGQILLTTTSPVRPYGFALDKAGNLWISGPNWGFEAEGRYIGRIDTKRCTDDASCNVEVCEGEGAADSCVKQRIPVGYQPYGITIDFKQRIWLAGEQILRYDHAAAPGSRTAGVNYNTFTHGIAADDKGFIWGAGSGGGLYRIDAETPDSYVVVTGTEGSPSKGVAVDLDGKVWSVNYRAGASEALVITPGPGLNDGQISATVGGLVTPYTYSDMTGSQLRFATDQLGYWRTIFEECPRADFIGTTWQKLYWDIETPTRTSVTLRVRAGFDRTGLSQADWIDVVTIPSATSPFDLNPLLLSRGLHKASFVEVEARLDVLREPGQQNTPPKLKSLVVTKSCPPIVN